MTTAGYVSEDAKRSYTVLVGVLAVLALGAQFVAPMFGMFAVMPSFFAMGVSGLRQSAFDRGVITQGALWYPEHSVPTPGQTITTPRLGRIALVPETKPEIVASDLPDDAFLLAQDRSIWVLSDAGVSAFTGGQMRGVPIEGESPG